jgi:hypothetical protein
MMDATGICGLWREIVQYGAEIRGREEGETERRGWGLRGVPMRGLWACERKWGRERGGFVSKEGGVAVVEDDADKWARVARERRKGLWGSGLARRLLG